MANLVVEISEQYVGEIKQFRIMLKDPPRWPSVYTDLQVSENDPQIKALAGGLLDPGGPGPITATAGGHLLDQLLKDRQIAGCLSQMLATTGTETQPIYISFNTTELEGLPWEALFASQGLAPNLSDSERFLGLSRWPVGRTLSVGPEPAVQAPFAPPLRMAFVLSCLKVPAAPEWSAISAALDRPAAVDTEILVLVGEPEMLTTIPSIPGRRTVEMVPDTVPALQRRLIEFAPHVLHFFCHGSAAGGGHLLVSPASDHASGRADEPLIIEDTQLMAMAPPPMDAPWLLVLNCCEGAAGGKGQESLGARLVQRGPFPVVVAMREPVLSRDAATFTGALYDRLLPEIAERAAGTRTGPWNWPDLLVDPRREVAGLDGTALSAAAPQHRAWTLPVMYVARPDFSPGFGEPDSRSDRLTLDVLTGLLAALPPDAPAQLLAELRDRIAALQAGRP